MRPSLVEASGFHRRKVDLPGTFPLQNPDWPARWLQVLRAAAATSPALDWDFGFPRIAEPVHCQSCATWFPFEAFVVSIFSGQAWFDEQGVHLALLLPQHHNDLRHSEPGSFHRPSPFPDGLFSFLQEIWGHRSGSCWSIRLMSKNAASPGQIRHAS